MLSVVTSTQVNQLTSELSLNWPQQGGFFCFSSETWNEVAAIGASHSISHHSVIFRSRHKKLNSFD